MSCQTLVNDLISSSVYFVKTFKFELVKDFEISRWTKKLEVITLHTSWLSSEKVTKNGTTKQIVY